MNRIFKLIIGCSLILLVMSCDVDTALISGELEDYNFTNAALKHNTVDESLIEEFVITSVFDGVSADIAAVYIGDQDRIAEDTVIFYLHGNASSMNIYWEIAADCANIGNQHQYGVFMFDYRGYGQSTGTSENINTMLADTDACLQWLKDKGLTSDRVIFYGNSLGTLPGSHAAAYSEVMTPAKLIIEAPQTSANVLGQDALGGLSIPAAMLTDFGFDIPTALDNYKNDFLWIHGTADEVASYENMLIIYTNYDNPKKQSYIVPGASHGVIYDMGVEVWEAVMVDFLRD